MTAAIFISSLIIALVILPALAWKWNIKISTAVSGAVIFGGLSGLVTYWIHTSLIDLHIALLIFIELCLILGFSAVIILLRFYRDPERNPPETKNVILSPADGTVVYINKVEKGSSLVVTKGKQKFKLNEITSTDLLTNSAYMMGIDMNVLNVHINRAPIGGNVLFCHRTKGKFISLRRPESEIMNERVTTIIGDERFKIGVIQISSRLVRKIIMRIKEGEGLSIGQRIGSIVFGSQVNVIIPELENIKIEVKVNDEVRAGITVIARY